MNEQEYKHKVYKPTDRCTHAQGDWDTRAIKDTLAHMHKGIWVH